MILNVSIDNFRISYDPLINFFLILNWQCAFVMYHVYFISAHELFHRVPSEMFNKLSERVQSQLTFIWPTFVWCSVLEVGLIVTLLTFACQKKLSLIFKEIAYVIVQFENILPARNSCFNTGMPTTNSIACNENKFTVTLKKQPFKLSFYKLFVLFSYFTTP